MLPVLRLLFVFLSWIPVVWVVLIVGSHFVLSADHPFGEFWLDGMILYVLILLPVWFVLFVVLAWNQVSIVRPFVIHAIGWAGIAVAAWMAIKTGDLA